MKLQMTSNATNVVAFADREIVEFDHFTGSQGVKVVRTGDPTELTNLLGLLIVRGGSLLFGVRVHPRMATVAPAVHLSQRLVVIVYDDQLIGIDLESRERVVDTALDSPFREIIEIPEIGSLVCSDADIQAFDLDWKKMWRYSGDLIESCRLDQDGLVVRFVDGQPAHLSLRTGEPRAPSVAAPGQR